MGSKKVYVAIGKVVEEYEETLGWVFETFKGKIVCLIHVLVPSKTKALPNGLEVPVQLLGTKEAEAFRKREKEGVVQLFKDCSQMFDLHQVPCENNYFIKRDSIEEGILELIRRNKITQLVMGATTSSRHWRGMATPTSDKAKHVLQFAPDSCHVWFVCKDHLIYKRGGTIQSRPSELEERPSRSPDTQDAMKGTLQSKPADRLYNDEGGSRTAMESQVDMDEKLDNITSMFDRISQECTALPLERPSENTDLTLKDEQEMILSEIHWPQDYKILCDKLVVERDNALRKAEKLREQLAQGSSSAMGSMFSEFSFSELDDATNHFDPSLKLGESGYGSVYKGFLRYTNVAIELLNPDTILSPRVFDEEVHNISKLRHPKLVTLIGCLPPWALIYEYLPGGTLEDRLLCENNSPPLPWRARIQIATEICSALIFLHSSNVIHGGLGTTKVLLDENYRCKLSGFGEFTSDRILKDWSTVLFIAEPAYIDPEIFSTGKLSSNSDTYSFGIVMLCLLTGKPALGIARKVADALENNDLSSVLDLSSEDWPYAKAQQLANLALRCCDSESKNRPDLASDVCRVLEPMLASCSSTPSAWLLSDDQAPDYFNCPILQEIMEDPHFAADGFTYEAEAIKNWFERGHGTSPMTNVELKNFELIPNCALRSAIQEWKATSL